MEKDPLEVDPETMRRLGYRTVDLLVDRLAGLRDIPVLRHGSPAEMARRLDGPPPEGPERFERILEQLAADVLPFLSVTDHPAYFAYVPGSGTWPGVMGDLIASACNIEASYWAQAPGPNQVELTVLGWFKQWIGYPPEAAGVLVSGGSAANLTALACAREALLGAMSDQVVAYVSDQAHSSMARAARVLGFRPNQRAGAPVGRAATGCAPTPWRRRWPPTCAGAGGRCSWRPAPGRPAPVRWTRWPSWPRSAASGGCGSTSTPPMAASPC